MAIRHCKALCRQLKKIEVIFRRRKDWRRVATRYGCVQKRNGPTLGPSKIVRTSLGTLCQMEDRLFVSAIRTPSFQHPYVERLPGGRCGVIFA